tara:strand:- start:293 stop:1543 length:1251 start_codon:yes stop_codon:yes gene_type:complete
MNTFFKFAITLLSCFILINKSFAHAVPDTMIFMDINNKEISLELELPLSELKIADANIYSSAVTMTPGGLEALQDYLESHIILTSQKHIFKDPSINNTHLKVINSNDYIITTLTYSIHEQADITDIKLYYDAILHRVVSHKAHLTLRSDFNSGVFSYTAKILGTYKFSKKEIHVDRSTASVFTGFKAMMMNGLLHIANGLDHILFLLCLLLPAPLLLKNKSWSNPAPVKECIYTIVKTVTGFTLGHSVTLSLAVLNIIRIPSTPVEIVVAASIAFTALNAIKPLFVSSTWKLAIGFGFIHGFAFANEMIAHGFTTQSIILALVGFNLGIEFMQLAIVACVLPCLYLMSRTSLYTYFRNTFAIIACIIALFWVAERSFDIANPFNTLLEQLQLTWYWVYAAFIGIGISSLGLKKIAH